MAEFLHNVLGNPASASSYSVARSLRFNAADSARLTRTPGSAGNRSTFTLAFWAKRCKLSSWQILFGCWDGSSSSDGVRLDVSFEAADTLSIIGGTTIFLVTSRVFRDPSAWYHIVIAVDTTQGTANNRIRVYVNGTEETAFGTRNNPTSSFQFGVNNTIAHAVGARASSAAQYYDGYVADFHLVDGTALTPSSFGETDATTGQWVPKAYTGSYGANGFWLSFYDNTSTTTLGRDDAGGAAGSAAGSNDWTLNNLSVTAGVGNDSLTDTPTNNYPTLNPLTNINAATLTNGNLYTAAVGASGNVIRGTQTIPSNGLVYFEATFVGTVGSGTGCCGIIDVSTAHTNSPTSLATVPSTMWLWRTDGFKVNAGTSSSLGSITSGQVFQCAVDRANNKVWFGSNGTWFGSGDPAAGSNAAYTNLAGDIAACVNFQGTSGSPTWELNFGQRPFAHTPPTGFSALCTSNLPTPSIVKPSAQFGISLFAGTGASLDVTNSGMQPDLVWVKNRAAAINHGLFDSARGVSKALRSNLPNAENTASGVTAFNSNGFTIGSDFNANGQNHIAWQWKEGVTPGFDIVTGTSTGTSGTLSMAHSLGVTPAFVLVKNRSISDVWWVHHKSLSSLTNSYMALNTTAAVASATDIWGHTSSNIVVAQGSIFSASGQNLVAYAFAEVAGFSKFGSYTGNGSADGPFVHCGFRPRFVMAKRVDTSGTSWVILDSARDVANGTTTRLFAEAVSADNPATPYIDLMSNGFKVRTADTPVNASGGTYIFAAFAEYPFKYANAR